MVDLLPIDADDPRLDRLMQLYLHEWSALLPVRIGSDARYDFDDLVAYAEGDEQQRAYLLVAEERPIGFALACQDAEAVWHIEEFFLIAGARGRGLGAEAARRLLATHPGPWTWTVRPENPAALAFWTRVFPAAAIDELLGDDGVTRTRLRVVAG